MNMVVRGRKGGKGSSGGRVDKDNLLTDSTAYILGLIGEGEIEGLANEEVPESCILLDGVPIKNEDGTANIEGVEWWLRKGTPDQDPIPGFAAVENEVDVGAKVEFSSPQERTITSAETDALRVKISIPALVELTSEGDRIQTEVSFRILIKPGAAAWQEVKSDTIRGKTTSGYQRTYRIDLPDIRPLIVRVERVTEDSEDENLQNDLYFRSVTEIIDAKLSYPDCAVIGLAIPAKAVGGGVQRITVKVRGMKCLVPSNYDPIARTYDETNMWDGTFKSAWCRNPVWAAYTTFLEERWGLGEAISTDMFDKWTAYQQAKYSDELVPDGQGGTEHRFSLDGDMRQRDAAYAWITKLSAAFRAVTYWGAGAVVPVQDAPSDPVRLVTNSEVEDGEFTYSGTPMSARHTSAVVALQDADDHNKIKPLVSYENFEALERYGENLTEITAPFKQSLGEGLRLAKWAVETNTTQAEIVSFVGGFGFGAVRPGDVILVSDKYRIGHRRGGRVVAITLVDGVSHVELDAPLSLPDEETHQIRLSDDLGNPHLFQVVNSGQNLTVLELSVALGGDFVPGARFAVQSSNLTPREYKVLLNRPDEKKKTHEIKAIEFDPTKFARVEQGISVKTDAGHLLPSPETPSAPKGLSLVGYMRPDHGSKSKLVLEASWERHDNPLVQKYGIFIKGPNSGWQPAPDAEESVFEWHADGDASGEYRIRVTAINALGRESRFAEAEFGAEVLFEAPEAPVGWVGRPGVRMISLYGPVSQSPNFKEFRIYGAGGDSEDLTYLGSTSSSGFHRAVPEDDTFFVRYCVSEVRHGVGEGVVGSFIYVSPTPIGAEDVGQDVFDRVAEDTSAIVQRFQETVVALTEDGLERLAEQSSLAMVRERKEEIAAKARVEAARTELRDAIDMEALARETAISVLQAEATGLAADIIAEQVARIAQDDALAASIAALTVQGDGLSASFQAEQAARIAGDDALALDLQSLDAVVQGNSASIATETAARVAADSALAGQITSLQAEVDGVEASVATEASARSSADAAISSQITSLNALINGVGADVTTETAARVAGDQANANSLSAYIASNDAALAGVVSDVSVLTSSSSAQASQITTINATLGTQNSTITSQGNAIAGLGAAIRWQIDVNGHISGFALHSEIEAGGAYSTFTFATDAFRIAGAGGAAHAPFVLYTSDRVINGVTVPAGLYLEGLLVSENLKVTGSMSATFAEIGFFQSSASGGRMEMSDNKLQCFDENNIDRCTFGYLL